MDAGKHKRDHLKQNGKQGLTANTVLWLPSSHTEPQLSHRNMHIHIHIIHSNIYVQLTPRKPTLWSITAVSASFKCQPYEQILSNRMWREAVWEAFQGAAYELHILPSFGGWDENVIPVSCLLPTTFWLWNQNDSHRMPEQKDRRSLDHWWRHRTALALPETCCTLVLWRVWW